MYWGPADNLDGGLGGVALLAERLLLHPCLVFGGAVCVDPTSIVKSPSFRKGKGVDFAR